MLQLLVLVGRARALGLRGDRELVLENLAIRQQLIARQRTNPRPRLQARDRLLDCLATHLGELAHGGRTRSSRDLRGLASHVARPAVDPTLNPSSERPSARRAGDPRPRREMTTANPLWGAPQIHRELRTLGRDVSERTVSRLLTRVTRPMACENSSRGLRGVTIIELEHAAEPLTALDWA